MDARQTVGPLVDAEITFNDSEGNEHTLRFMGVSWDFLQGARAVIRQLFPNHGRVTATLRVVPNGGVPSDIIAAFDVIQLALSLLDDADLHGLPRLDKPVPVD